MENENEYYVVVDNVKKEVSVCNYLFDTNHPRGFERKVFARSYDEDSAWNYQEAMSFCIYLCDVFNSESFRKESVSFVKPHNN